MIWAGKRLWLGALTVLSLLVCSLVTSSRVSADVDTYSYRIIETFPHATDVFTQGLVYQDNTLFESAGMYGESRLLTRTLDNIAPLKQQTLDQRLFAEGITILGDSIYQLTWKSRRGFIYDKNSLQLTGEFKVAGEGWGITDDGHQLIISDGSNQLFFMNPVDFKVTKTLQVYYHGNPVKQLNELEWIDGRIYANIWGSDWIVMIDPNSGDVTGKVHLDKLLPDELRTYRTDVLNGIAFDTQKRRLLVTGKYWPRLYHIELIAPADSPPSPSAGN